MSGGAFKFGETSAYIRGWF